MIVKTAEPLSVEEVFALTGYDAVANIDGLNARIMNLSEGQNLEAERVVTWKDLKWAVKPLQQPTERYDYMAFRVE